ncbi:Acg family FMN-binding oxidoreductase [Actinokineospora terrae]|uniref:Acg family FMN-binding oxidoreductase n=1 Tax=Actinokineospora terrae TaxID=155974 RepID=UPI001FE3D5EA|nr:nitroreductase family protein [Actinokineospora terrae]
MRTTRHLTDLTGAARTAPPRWTEDEVAVLAAALTAAPSVHNSQPWSLRLRDRTATVFERVDITLPRHDPMGRDRLVSCGAAVANLRLAVRRLGWTAPWRQFPDQAAPGAVAEVEAGGPAEPTETELAGYGAIARRSSHRGPFAAEPVDPALLRSLRDTAADVEVPGVVAHVLRGEDRTHLARVLSHSALVLRQDDAYQRELAAWRGGEGIATADAPWSLPWAGLVDRTTAVPDDTVLAERLARESYLVVGTTGDGRSDHLHAGMLTQRLWLAAVAAGLACSIMTQPLHVPESRAGLIERLELAGYPQVLVRLGHPAHPPRPTSRRPLAEVVHIED